MFRPSFLNENSCGFHGRSPLMSSSAARQIMKGIQAGKGYRDPTDDCESIVFPVEQPCSVLNLSDDMYGLIPLKVWRGFGFQEI